MEELQIPTRSLEVEVFTLGPRRIGRLFFSEADFQTGTRRALATLLNDDRSFVPFALTSERAEGEPKVIMLNKHQILRVHVAQVVEETEQVIEEPTIEYDTSAALLLVDGTRVAGMLAVETPWESSRLVDKLNQVGRFIPVLHEHGFDLVQALHVVEVF